MTLRILAYGANGSQMAAGTQAPVDAGHQVRAFTRSTNGAERWQAAGVNAVTGDMSDLDALRRASEGQDALFLHVPLITDPNDDRNIYGLNALQAAKEAGIERVVWNTGGPIIGDRDRRCCAACPAGRRLFLSWAGADYLHGEPAWALDCQGNHAG
ncbi:NmrA family NAD(P)-binding protein [uncultured Ruegeria sp.]|uniref:SDR family oxidoreductase n=1 Tax=uncultured Ruegeria sp. TaxID=259304 RepID=UPI00260F0A88|nr:NmrA family NAD(P)-binding protein [uncultured Ruegeria sp.]